GRLRHPGQGGHPSRRDERARLPREADDGGGKAGEDDEAQRRGGEAPQAEPGEGGKKAGKGQERRGDRPPRLPQQIGVSASDGAFYARLSRLLDAAAGPPVRRG